MKTYLLIILFFVKLTHSVYSQSTKIFDGFNTMDVPRSKIPIGAIWTESGPIGDGVKESQLKSSNSYNEFSTSKNPNLSAELGAKITDYLKANLSVTNKEKFDVTIESITVVQLNDIEVLKRNIGNEILYEGIKADKISYIINKDYTVELKADLSKVFKNLAITSETQMGNDIKITTSGTDLFIAFRIIKLEKKGTKVKKIKFKQQSSTSGSSAKISARYYFDYDNYNITLCPCDIVTCVGEKINENDDNPDLINKNFKIWLTNCLNENKWEITILDKNNISNGLPSEKILTPQLPFDIWNKNFALSNRINSDGLEIDYLNIEHLYFDVKLMNSSLFGGYFYLPMKGDDERVNLIKERISFGNVIPKADIGW